MELNLLDQFDREITCTYRGEKYSVRDNGKVFRHSRVGNRKRPKDDKWDFGRANDKRGYMYLSSTPVHRIVATAFLGPEPSKDHVVDHKDRNRRNNRPENLRWVTKIKHLFINEASRRVIELAYGSIENFLEDPGQPLPGKLPPNFKWMRTVTKKEAEANYRRTQAWAKSGRTFSGGKIGEWIFETQPERYIQKPEQDDLIEALTPGAIQKSWKTPNEFPHCPATVGENTLDEYLQNLKEGVVFSRDQYGEAKVVSAALTESLDALVVMCNKPGVKDWSLARVYIDGQHFVHEARATYFRLDGAQKYFTLERGLEWEGGDTFDDLVR